MPSANAANSIIVRDSSGLRFKDGPPKFSGNSTSFENVDGKIKFMTLSPDGNRVAWIGNGVVCVVEGPEWKRIGTLQHPKAQEISFSSQGNFLAVWDTYIQVAGCPIPLNLSIYDVTGRKLLKSFTQKSYAEWQPQWTKDETVMARRVNNEVHFYEGNDLEKYKYKKSFEKLSSFSLSPSVNNHYITFFIPSMKSAPAFVHLYKYPNFQGHSNVIANKSFFKVETVETFWNNTCSAVLLLTTAEVDKTKASYYGEQMLFFLNTRGDSNRVTFSKKGNIRSVAWSPSSREFFCVYGHAPAKATIFNLKCDAIAEFGEGARNLVLLNPQGNLVLLGAMGNISSRFEIWDVKERKQVGKQECPDITHMEWSPCGQYILTSTCSPRLRVNNGFKIWHYTGALLHETLYQESEELYCSTWHPNANLAKPFEISSKQVAGIQSQEKKVTSSTKRYIPPNQRSEGTGKPPETSTKFLSQYEEPVVKEEVPKAEPKAPKGDPKEKKKAQKKKKDAAKKKKEKEKVMKENWREEKPEEEATQEKKKKEDTHVPNRMRNIKKKLEAIEKLKADVKEGKTLDEGQMKKINSQAKLEEELKKLEELSIS